MTAPARGRAAFDPFAPAPAPFPRARLLRAGLEDETVDRLRAEYDAMDRYEKRELARFITRNPDRVLTQRFQATHTREQLEAMTVDEDLVPLLRRRGLPTSGRKAEQGAVQTADGQLVDRLLESYQTHTGVVPASAALTGSGAPQGTGTPADGPEAASGQQGAQDEGPAQTSGADAAPDAAPTGADTDQEGTDRG